MELLVVELGEGWCRRRRRDPCWMRTREAMVSRGRTDSLVSDVGPSIERLGALGDRRRCELQALRTLLVRPVIRTR
jgi:hypothetical protein